VHFLRNALDHLPRRANDDCLQELRWIYDRREITEVRRDLAAWLSKWSGKYARLCTWVEDNIEETLTYYRLPLSHHKHMKSTNMLEQLNQEIKRRTHVVRIFPSPATCLRLVRALAVETHEEWLKSPRYLNMEDLREHKKQQIRAAAWPASRPARGWHRAHRHQGRCAPASPVARRPCLTAASTMPGDNQAGAKKRTRSAEQRNTRLPDRFCTT
jgi:hypothetical protein